MKNAVVTECYNGMVQVETRDAVVTVTAANWTKALLIAKQDTNRAAIEAERLPGALVVRY